MIALEEVLKLHDLAIMRYGGSEGVRDVNMLESAIARPFQTFDNQELYLDSFEKVAALFESLIKNHPFIDGNKRTAFLAAIVFLYKSGYELMAASDETTYDFVVSVASSPISFTDISDWFRQNSQSII